MAVKKFRYRLIEPSIDIEQLQSEVGSTAIIDEAHAGLIENVSIEETLVADLDESMALRGFTRIGTDVSDFPAEDEDFSGWKENVLTVDQLFAGATGGILQAWLGDIATNPADGDTFIISDGITTETFTFRTTPTVAFDVQIGGSASATETNLVTQINVDSTLWLSAGTNNLGPYFSGLPSTQFVVHRALPSLAADRIFGVIAGGQSGIQAVEFESSELQEYVSNSGVQSDLPSSDPGVKTFGFGRLRATLRTAETHWTVEALRPFTWDENAEAWISAASSDGSNELLFGSDSVGSTTTQRFLHPSYSDDLAQTAVIQRRVSRSGTIRNMRVRHNNPKGNGLDIVYTVRKNSTPTTLNVTLASTAADGSDLVDSFTVSAGDLIDVAVTKAAVIGASPRDITTTMEFTI